MLYVVSLVCHAPKLVYAVFLRSHGALYPVVVLFYPATFRSFLSSHSANWFRLFWGIPSSLLVFTDILSAFVCLPCRNWHGRVEVSYLNWLLCLTDRKHIYIVTQQSYFTIKKGESFSFSQDSSQKFLRAPFSEVENVLKPFLYTSSCRNLTLIWDLREMEYLWIRYIELRVMYLSSVLCHVKWSIQGRRSKASGNMLQSNVSQSESREIFNPDAFLHI
jgi:hypothetical protein